MTDLPVNDLPVNDLPVNDLPVNDLPITRPLRLAYLWHIVAVAEDRPANRRSAAGR